MNVAANKPYHAGGNHSRFGVTVLINQTTAHMQNKETQQLHNYATAKAMRQTPSLGCLTTLLILNRSQVHLDILLN